MKNLKDVLENLITTANFANPSNLVGTRTADGGFANPSIGAVSKPKGKFKLKKKAKVNTAQEMMQKRTVSKIEPAVWGEDYQWNTKFKKWVEITPTDIDNDTWDNVWKMYTITYESQGINNFKNLGELQADIGASGKMFLFMDIDNDPDPDCFFSYSEKNGNKKLSAMGSDGSDLAKRIVKNKLYKLMRTPGWYLEASKKIDKILKYKNTPFIDDEQIIKTLIDKKFTMIPPEEHDGESGYYHRELTGTGEVIEKRIYGMVK